MKLTHNVIIIILYFKKLLTWMGFDTKLPMVKLHKIKILHTFVYDLFVLDNHK
jgi:hypothetical protein